MQKLMDLQNKALKMKSNNDIKPASFGETTMTNIQKTVKVQ